MPGKHKHSETLRKEIRHKQVINQSQKIKREHKSFVDTVDAFVSVHALESSLKMFRKVKPDDEGRYFILKFKDPVRLNWLQKVLGRAFANRCDP